MHLFCFGYGYVAKFLSRKLSRLGWRISGTSSRNLATERVDLFDYDRIDKSIFQYVTHVLVSIPPDGDNIVEKYGSCIQNVKWIGYLSSTSVYGDHLGEWVTEESETKPKEIKGKKRLKSEKKWLDSSLPVNIFRLSAIYGPGRNVLINLQLNKVRNVRKEGHFFSHIYVEDIANILFASMQNIRLNQVYNCADDSPIMQSEIISHASKLLNISVVPEPIEVCSLSDCTRSFYLGSKKIVNTKVKRDLGISLIYPSYKIGLKSLYNKSVKNKVKTDNNMY